MTLDQHRPFKGQAFKGVVAFTLKWCVAWSMLQKMRIPPAAVRVFLTVLVFAFYLSVLPPLLPRFIPCMNPAPNQQFQLAECSAVHILDSFIVSALIGMTILTLLLFFSLENKRIATTTVFLIIAGGITIGSYYYFAKYAENIAATAPVILYDPERIPETTGAAIPVR